MESKAVEYTQPQATGTERMALQLAAAVGILSIGMSVALMALYMQFL
jgi:hypothetical protein